MIKISNKWLHIFYSIIYLKVCVLFAYIHLLMYLDDYSEQLSVAKLSPNELDDLINFRGLRKEDNNQSQIELIKNTGIVYKSELATVNKSISNNQIYKVFNTAGEFLESVEDSRESIWLVHIVHGGKSKYINASDWLELTNHLAKFDILTGRFNCQNDPYFCQERGWVKPKLVLILGHTVAHNYNECAVNSNEMILKWIEIILRNRLLIAHDFDSYPYQKKIHDEQDKLKLKIYYKAHTNQIPLYYSAVSVKYKARAKFYLINNTSFPNNLSNLCTNETQNTPIFLIVDNKICYNYGNNLNEIPNYAHLSLFLIIIYPDMNNILLISFFLLNTFLLMFFFEYNISIFKQILRGLFYLCIFNFILFSIWLFTLNSNKLNSIISNILYQVRYLILFNNITKPFFVNLRFVCFYYIYIKPLNAIFLYLISSFIYYAHTRWNHLTREYPQMRVSIKTNFANPIQLERQQTQTDTEIGVTELINQINGLTTIWLESSNKADRLINELPNIEYCVCFYANLVRKKTCDETDHGESTEDEELLNHKNFKKMKCECGRNDELNKYFDDSELSQFWEKFSRECSICLSRYKYNCLIVNMPCGHNFHRQCIYEWFMSSIYYKLSCPICRAFFNFKKTI